MATYSCHSEGVWALQANEAFTQVLTALLFWAQLSHPAPLQVVSSGRDAAIYLTDLRQTERHSLVCRETSPVLRMVSSPCPPVLLLFCHKVRLSFPPPDLLSCPTGFTILSNCNHCFSKGKFDIFYMSAVTQALSR